MSNSVRGRIDEIKQPRGGYVKPSGFTMTQFDDGKILNGENIPPTIMGLAVDYLTRLTTGAAPEDAFRISLTGMESAVSRGCPDVPEHLLSEIGGLDDRSIKAACRLASYDIWYRDPYVAERYFEEAVPDGATIENIRTMVGRAVSAVEPYGPIVSHGFTFRYGYTDTVCAGDGDFMSEDTMWDMKVSKNPPTSKDTLQLLMYWIMGRHSGNDDFLFIERLGFVNPRLNRIYTIDVDDIPEEVIETVENDVIRY